MTVSMEVKKDGLRQTQDGIWKLTLTILPEDMPVELLQAAMGSVYGLAMTPIDYDNPEVKTPTNIYAHQTGEGEHTYPHKKEQSEGDKLRVRAVMLCKDNIFWSFMLIFARNFIREYNGSGESAKMFLYDYCNIESRSELTTNVEAQEKFKRLDQKFKDWKVEQQYTDNLQRF